MAAALWAGAGTLAALALAQPVNHAAAEARPWQSLPHALILAGHSTDFSFPPDHAVMADAATAGLFLASRRLGSIALVAAVVLCFGRVYIGAHYPQDVAAGLALGAAVVLAGYLIIRRPLTALVILAARSPARPLLASGPRPDPTPARPQPPLNPVRDAPAGRLPGNRSASPGLRPVPAPALPGVSIASSRWLRT
jgi:membrane-associated phospholipid phosphatase